MRLHIVIPAILVVTGVANIALRFLPPDRIALRSWEAVTLFVTKTGPFAAEKHYFNPGATGDLGTLANLPAYRCPHPETFTTGPHGYRRYEPGADPPAAAILFGDSFGAGASLTDGDDLCSRLTPVFGGPVFFAAYCAPNAVRTLRHLPKAPFVILQISERYPVNNTASADGRDLAGVIKRLAGDGSSLYRTLRYVRDLSAYSPMEIWAGRAYRYLQNDAVLPNVHGRNVCRYTLINRSEMLFLRSEVSDYYSPQPVAVGTVVAMQREIEAQRFRVIVILVPNKFTVYYPLIQAARPGPAEDRLYINVLERELRLASVSVVNLSPALRRAAAEALTRNELIYHLDDTHWNAAGVAVASEEVRRFLNSARPRVGPSPIERPAN